MAMMTLDTETFKMILKSKAEYRTLAQYCSDKFFYNEWRTFTVSEMRELFNDYVDESSVATLIKERRWRNIFESAPTLCGDEIYLSQ